MQGAELHAHIWGKDQEEGDPIELDAMYTGTYIDEKVPSDSDYIQFGVGLPDGNFLELRVDVELLQKMLQEVRRVNPVLARLVVRN